MRIPKPERSVLGDLPSGFGMALLGNTEAYNRFFLLPEEERQNIIDGVYSLSTNAEMRDYVSRTLLPDIVPDGNRNIIF
ncbi:MAG: hypothetical protein E7638_08770 [Ruminococcaceae bacterium]|nr:hypothetical protein [Oscillospiraceae bacterium]